MESPDITVTEQGSPLLEMSSVEELLIKAPKSPGRNQVGFLTSFKLSPKETHCELIQEDAGNKSARSEGSPRSDAKGEAISKNDGAAMNTKNANDARDTSLRVSIESKNSADPTDKVSETV